LLIWWAIEAHCQSNRDAVLGLFSDAAVWRLPLVQDHILEHVMRRFAMAGTRQDFATCAQLLRLSPGPEQTARLISGFEAAFKGRSMAELPEALAEALAQTAGESVILGLRRGDPAATEQAIRAVADPNTPSDKKLSYVEILGELKVPKSEPVLLDQLTQTHNSSLQRAALTALQQFEQPEIAQVVLEQFTGLDEQGRAAALSLLASRPVWSLELLEAVDAGRIPAKAISPDAVQKIKTYPDKRIAELVTKHCTRERVPTTAEMQQQIVKSEATVANGAGNPYEGRKLFTMSCGLCHKLFSQGGQIGPDLTPYKRDDLPTMLLNIVNPSAEIREGYETYLVSTKDGRTLSGFLADKDNRVVVLRGLDGVNQVLPQDEIKEMKSTGVSLMPQGLLNSLSDQQLRDLFAYLQSAQPLAGDPPQR